MQDAHLSKHTLGKNMHQHPQNTQLSFTPAQSQAIHSHSHNLIVTAGAGSGKTRVLVERFLALLEQNPDWRLTNIVAITFTEKAAREMRERVRSTITKRLHNPTYAAEHELWRHHEANLDAARIGTIHSLCAQILQANPVEAALDPEFSVLDEVETVLLAIQAVESTLTLLKQTPRSTTNLLLHDYDLSALRDTLQVYCTRSTALTFLDMLQSATPDTLLATWQQLWHQSAQATLNAIQHDEFLQANLYWIDDKPQPTHDRLWECWAVVLDERESLLHTTDPQQLLATIEKLIAEIKVNKGSKNNWGGEEGFKEVKAILTDIRERLQAYKGQFLPPPAEIDQQAAELLMGWRDAVQVVSDEFTRLKAERNALDFDDLEVLTLQLLENHPQVAQRYVMQEFKHIMVDEFQDTNDIQRRIIYALAGINPQTGQAVAGRLFVVGDPKQSIYAFRGADVSVFDRVRHELLTLGGQEIALQKSFRSHHVMLDMLNTTFDQILQPNNGPMRDFYVRYEAMEASRPSADHLQTPVTLFILQKPPKEEVPQVPNTAQMRQWEALELGRHLQDMVENATLVWDKEQNQYRPMTYGDITILFQAITNTYIYEGVFQQLGLPYVTIAGKGYFDRQEVWDLMNLLAALHSPSDNLALATVLRSPIFGLSDDALLALRLRDNAGETLSLWEALMAQHTHPNWPPIPTADRPALEFAQQTLQSIHHLAGRITIADLLERILELTGYQAILTALPNGTRRRANLNKLLEVARQSELVSLGDFNSFLRQKIASEAREGEALVESEGVITLMTVHKSKGLEFPVVVLADTSWSLRSRDNAKLLHDPLIGPACLVPDPQSEDPKATTHKPFIYQLAIQYAAEREDAERQRLLYVAATRAQDYLIISGAAKSEKSTAKPWLQTLRQALSNAHDPLTQQFDPSPTPSLYQTAWGNIALTIPPMPSLDNLNRLAWDTSAYFPHPDDLPTENLAPIADYLPLMAEVSPTKFTQWHISATDLEKLGNPYLNDFRHTLLHDLPAPIKPLGNQQLSETRIIGNMVHRALKVGLLPEYESIDNIRQSLNVYAFDEGINNKDRRQALVDEALSLLNTYERSAIVQNLKAAQEIHREIAFSYEQGAYIVHGIIDTLFRLGDQWYVLDYKTGKVDPSRYVYQMGAYARAVELQTKTTPKVLLYFLSTNQLKEVDEDAWRVALKALDREITRLSHHS